MSIISLAHLDVNIDRQTDETYETERLIRKCCSTGGFSWISGANSRIQQKSITECFSGALGNKIAGHKKKKRNKTKSVALTSNVIRKQKSHSVQQQQQPKKKKINTASSLQRQCGFFFLVEIGLGRGLCFAGCLNRYYVYAAYEVSQAFLSVCCRRWR